MDGMDLNDIFGNMFGGGMGGQRRRKSSVTKRDHIIHQLELSLEELYAGVVKPITVNRQKVWTTYHKTFDD
jgi:DnaJ-class molecular chaperone